MAKISARGATEIARLVKDQHTYIFTWNGREGRVLSQITYSDGSGRSGCTLVLRKASREKLQSYIDGLQRNAGYRPAR